MLNELLIKELSEQVGINTSDIQSIKDGEIYSTSEIKTNKIWIDGKPIYTKVYIGTYSGSGLISIPESDLDYLINYYGYIRSKYDERYVPIPSVFTSDASYNAGVSFFRSNRIEIRLGSNFSNSSVYAFVIEYTKTTD